MSGTYAQRIALDKSGEFVELCAKEDQLRGYLAGAIEEQVEINRAVGAQRVKTERDGLEERKRALEEDVAAKRARVARMSEVVAAHEGKVQRRAAAQKLIDWLREREEKVRKENEVTRERIARLEAEVAEQASLVRDLEQTVSITGSAALAGKKGKVHIKVHAPH
jgi:uncharacterized coiled-coil protein SlyX